MSTQARARRGGRPPAPLGTERRTQDGRVLVKAETGWVWKARTIVEELMGRPLEPGEEVRHRNGVEDDNDAGNLVVVTETQVWPPTDPKAGSNGQEGSLHAEKTPRDLTPEEEYAVYLKIRRRYVAGWRAKRAAQ